MSHATFVNRLDELSFLNERYRSAGSELIIISGRRRIGKTELLSHFLKEKPGIYALATTESESQNITLFSREFSRFLHDPQFEIITYPSFEGLFTSFIAHHRFRELSQNQKIILIIDEFPYLIERNKAIPSIFQRIWDLYLSPLPIMLILSGSSISIMEQEVLGYKSPLFGRRTGQWQVEPLSFSHLSSFLPWNTDNLVNVWFITGGVPAYLALFNSESDFWTNIEQLYLTKGAYLYIEAELLLQYEFREPANYLTILKALAQGCTTLGEIINESGLDRSMISKYLSVLIRLHMVREEVPVTASATIRRRHYRLTDPYLTFWFRFVYPDRTAIESRQTGQVLERIQDEFPRYGGPLFELLVEHLIRERIFLSDIPVGKLGRWWHKEVEIDIVGIHEPSKTLLCVECKNSTLSEQKSRSILHELQNKSRHIQWKPGERTDVFVLIGRKIEGKDALRTQGFRVYDLDDITLSGPDR